MRIAGAEFSAFALPLRRPLSTPAGRLESRAGFILTLASDAGIRGLGEASPAYWLGGERLEETRAALESIVAAARERCSPAELWRFISDRLAGDGRPFSAAAMAAAENALLDVAAQARGVAVASALGASSLEPLEVSALLSATAPDGLREEAASLAARGYRTLKLKVGAGSDEDELERLLAVRAGAGQAARLRLDANRAWTFERAVRALTAFAPVGLEFVEEPLASPSPRTMAELGKKTGIALALDESASSAADLKRFAEAGAADAVVLKAARLGGPTRCLELAAVARAAGMKAVVTDSIETGVGMRTAVHLAAALPGPRLAVGLGGARFLSAPHGALGDFPESPLVKPSSPGFAVEAVKRET